MLRVVRNEGIVGLGDHLASDVLHELRVDTVQMARLVVHGRCTMVVDVVVGVVD